MASTIEFKGNLKRRQVFLLHLNIRFSNPADIVLDLLCPEVCDPLKAVDDLARLSQLFLAG